MQTYLLIVNVSRLPVIMRKQFLASLSPPSVKRRRRRVYLREKQILPPRSKDALYTRDVARRENIDWIL